MLQRNQLVSTNVQLVVNPNDTFDDPLVESGERKMNNVIRIRHHWKIEPRKHSQLYEDGEGGDR